MNLYPLKFKPLSKYRIWGGEKLNTVLNKDFKGEHIGESWEISDVKGDKTRVINGPLAGRTLKSLIQEFDADLLGTKVYERFGTDFPLLIKFIDAKTPLSIQVHPHDEVAKERHNSFGKNEMWYIMDADPEAEIIVGFNKQLTSESYLNYLENGKVLDVLNKEYTKAGDAYYIPTGRVHAIGEGVLLAEIQQTSDVTYRIYDYERVEKSTGKTRDLHNDLALDVIDFTVHKQYNTNYTVQKNQTNTLIHTPYFKTNIIKIDQKIQRDYTAIDSFVIYICTAGKLELIVNNDVYSLKKGETIVLPGVIKSIELVPSQTAEILEVYC